MQIAEQSLKLLSRLQTTSEESECMSDYCALMVAMEEMKRELKQSKDKDSKTFKIKKERVDTIERAAHSFYKSYFSMCKYKEMSVRSDQKRLEKELELVNLICG